MGSSCEANGQSIDSTVGGLVWVRRRNGSWWPGRILRADELPKSCLVSPRRSGTPVKLLGREDASVDWYNLEKSKRVKAFRCGEYDECIEKAKNTASISCKKAVKYARREDAILHALELENSQLSKYNNEETTSQTEKTENISDKLSGLDFISVSPKKLSCADASADNSLEGIWRQTANDSEDDGTEGSKKRMRGLQDLGVGMAISSFKKKRTRVVHVYDFLKKKNRRRQLTKVLKKTEMVSIPVMCEQNTGLNGSGLSKYNELKGSFSDSTGDVTNNINANNCKQKEHENSSISELQETDDSSGRLFDVPFVREEKPTAGSSPVLVPETGQVSTQPQSGQCSLVETITVRPDEFQESGSINSGANISQIMDNNGTSRWQHKGKRNSRNKSKTKTMLSFLTPDREVNNTVEVTGPQRSMFIHQSCSTANPKYKPSDLGYKRADTGFLYDVNIEVQSGHFPRDLPYVSLLSNFTGQPVTGHSLEVEVFNDAASDLSLNSSECLSSSCELGGANGDVETVPEPSKKLRKTGLLSNKKTRKLSSLTGSKRPSETGALTRPDLACVPLKVVFGRINAALGITSADEGLTR
ncbi:hypothetical protein L1987_22758 [Smallanthus sonchifolius]|uniref:Uncharacterized protein n=1 Tax=Smallanthus sonchifolius TaxID=185202 RepID=A0ACB9IF08_9ASTR|nr:hypothetical protein L1987_22758 [Smallanthus sonchifolius]